MPSEKLTKAFIDTLPTPPVETVYWDASLAGFGVKATPAGRRVFIVVYRTADHRQRKYTIGPYGQLTLPQARCAAQQILAAKSAGRDPQLEKLSARSRATSNRVDALVAVFLEKYASRNRSYAETERIFRREVLPRWGTKAISEISRRDIANLLDDIAARAPIMSNRVLAAIRKFFNWLVGRGVLETSPCAGVSAAIRERTRDRILDDAELNAVLRVAPQLGFPFGSIVMLLALTGQRRDEVTNLTWEEINEPESIWNIPSSRTKNGKPHIIHLSQPALSVIRQAPRLGALAFSVDGEHPFQNFGHAKARLDAAADVHDWVLHDLRRTVVSGMARLGVPPHIADKILNHQTGTISGVAAVYQRHEFLAERRDALDRWGNHVRLLLSN